MISDATSESSTRSRNPMHQRVKEVAQTVVAAIRGDVDNGRGREDADDSWVSRPSSLPPNDSEFRVNDRRAVIPQWLILFLIVQGSGGIWWAATMQSDVRNLQRENLKLWESIKVLDLQREEVVKEAKDDIEDEVKEEVTEQLFARGLIRIQPAPQ